MIARVKTHLPQNVARSGFLMSAADQLRGEYNSLILSTCHRLLAVNWRLEAVSLQFYGHESCVCLLKPPPRSPPGLILTMICRFLAGDRTLFAGSDALSPYLHAFRLFTPRDYGNKLWIGGGLEEVWKSLLVRVTRL